MPSGVSYWGNHMKTTIDFLREYLFARPIFLSVLRSKEAMLYQQHLPLRRRVLDVGCGDGFFARVTFGNKKIDVGVDVGESRIDEAKQNNAYARIVTYDGKRLPFANRAFETVVINSVLEHTDDVTNVIAEMHRVLVSKGTCYATVMAKPWEDNLFGAKLLGDGYRRWMKKKQVHINLFTRTQWEAAFRAAGFRVESVIPYLSPHAALWLDVLHYLSIPSLVSYRINRRWVWWPKLTAWYPAAFFTNLMEEPVDRDHAGALFFVLKRP